MTTIFDTIKTVLERDCAVPVYFDKLPVNPGQELAAYIRFQRISKHQFLSQSGPTGLHRDRFQVTCMARTHAALLDLIDLMEQSLFTNHDDFKLSYPLETTVDRAAGAYTHSRDFYIFYEVA